MNWGFNISKPRVIDMDKADLSLVRLIIRQEPSLLRCIGCGGCTATCTAGNLNGFNFRRVHLLLHRGETQALEQEISRCMLCGKCSLVCPRGINTRNVIMAIRKAVVSYASV